MEKVKNIKNIFSDAQIEPDHPSYTLRAGRCEIPTTGRVGNPGNLLGACGASRYLWLFAADC